MYTPPNHRRHGFTLVEILVVIAIIALLMSLSIGAMATYIVSAREAATATTISKIQRQLQERVDGLRKLDFTDSAERYAIAQSQTPPFPVELAEIIVRKLRMKQAFPQNLTEAVVNDPYRYATLSSLYSSPPPDYLSKFESGIVLYAMLTSGETFGAPSVGEDLFSSSEIRISRETANLPCLVDAWGEPLRFYRWPTRLFKPDGSNINRTYAYAVAPSIGPPSGYGADGAPGALGIGGLGAYGSDDIPNCGPDGQPGNAGAGPLGAIGSDDYEPLNVDSDDPLLLLYPRITATANGVIQYEQGSTTGTPDLRYAMHTPFTYCPMLIISSGPDRQLGLLEPNDNSADCGYLACPAINLYGPTKTLQYLLDDISNLNLSGSGK